MTQDAKAQVLRSDLLELLAAASERASRDLAADVVRLKAHIASLEAELGAYQAMRSPVAEALEKRAAQLLEDNALLARSASDALSRLQQTGGELSQAQTEIADLTQELRRLQAEYDNLARRPASPAHPASAAEPPRAPAEETAELGRMRSELAALSAENERLRTDRSVVLHRAGRIEEHNRLLAESATTRELKLQHQERELTRLHIEIATLTPENKRLRAEHAVYAKRAADLDEHNQRLTANAIDSAHKVQTYQAQLPVYAKRAADLDEHNQQLTEHNQQLTANANETARNIQIYQAQLDDAAHKIQTYQAQLDFTTQRIQELSDHNQILTQAATERARQLQEIRQTDYQLLMAHQQLLAGMKDAEPRFYEIYDKCRTYTMTSVERLYALYKSVEYIVAAGIPGDLAEAGVWQGGSCMLIAETLLALGDGSRRILLFDTFEGHPKPDGEKDVDLWGNRAIDEWRREVGEDNHGNWGYVSLEDVQANMARTGFPLERLVFVKGLLENTAEEAASSIDKLAMLRLDTDWYASTKAGLEHFYPRVVSGGVLIVDDYGHYKGQQLAVDEYFAAGQQTILLNRIDYSCRLAVKP